MADHQENDIAADAFPLFTPIDTDYFRGVDDPAGGGAHSGNVTGTALKAYLKTYLDTLYYGVANVAYVTSAFSKTSDTTLANITGLTHTVVAGGVYRFRAFLMETSGASGGVKVAVSGTATATTINGIIANAITTSETRAAITALDAAVGATGVYIKSNVEGTIIVNVGGTLTIQFAQNASNGTASVVLVGSWFEVNKIA